MDVDDEHCHSGEEVASEEEEERYEEVATDDEEVQYENEELMVSTPVREVFSTPVHEVVEGNGELFEREVHEPATGMVFSSWEDADKFFREYGKQNGFGIFRAGGNYKQENGKPNLNKRRSYTWKCECAGKVDIRRRVDGARVSGGGVSLDLNRRKTKKCGCKVQMHCKVRDDCLWEVTNVVTKHTGHNPTPSKSRYIHMYRQDEITSVVRRRLFTDAKAGTKVRQIHRSLAKQRNGIENMTFTERDLMNILAKEKKLKMVGGDANAMLAYFDRMSADNQNFYHKYRLDDKNRLTDVMWVDARSRVAYEEFGDVVFFDSTYVTNEYELPFCNFVGVNHHGQSILLGCALVSHEDTKTFVWLFNNWLNCMGGKAPGGFLTDQCQAMRKALSITMPDSKHRWCLWHILSKFGTKLGKYSKYQEFDDVLQNVIYDSMSENEFEEKWRVAIETYGLGEDEWLSGMICYNRPMTLLCCFYLDS